MTSPVMEDWNPFINMKRCLDCNIGIGLLNSKRTRCDNCRVLWERYKLSRDIAKNRKIQFNLTFQQYKDAIALPCFYCDGKLCVKTKKAVGLDRLNNDFGYIPGNIVSCGKKCNSIKMHDLTAEETKAAVKAILLLRNKS